MHFILYNYALDMFRTPDQGPRPLTQETRLKEVRRDALGVAIGVALSLGAAKKSSDLYSSIDLVSSEDPLGDLVRVGEYNSLGYVFGAFTLCLAGKILYSAIQGLREAQRELEEGQRKDK